MFQKNESLGVRKEKFVHEASELHEERSSLGINWTYRGVSIKLLRFS